MCVCMCVCVCVCVCVCMCMCVCVCVCVCVGLTIGFTMTSINVLEGETAQLCVRVLNGMIGRDVPIQFDTQPDTAQGKNLRNIQLTTFSLVMIMSNYLDAIYKICS